MKDIVMTTVFPVSPKISTRSGILPRITVWLALFGMATLLAACGVNNVPTLEEKAKASWSEVQNQYQRRTDLIPNLVETVKGFAQQEKDVLTGVIEARAKASQIKVDASTVSDPAKFKEFQDAQNQLSGALGRLLVTVERYPDIKSNANFLALQSQLEGTENRIAVARRDYVEAVRVFNTEVRTFPGMIWARLVWGAKPMETFAAVAGSEKPPAVKF
jgi:LemA protein